MSQAWSPQSHHWLLILVIYTSKCISGMFSCSTTASSTPVNMQHAMSCDPRPAAGPSAQFQAGLLILMFN